MDTSMPNGWLMLQDCFIDFTDFDSCATELDYARDIGSIEIWLINS